MGLANTANGVQALFSNTSGNSNTASGVQALQDNLDGGNNTANGFIALHSNTSGSSNTANGNNALGGNTTGSNNTAIGSIALSSNSSGDFNTAVGNGALSSNTTGSSNIALGVSAGLNLTMGDRNIDIGNTGQPGDIETIRIGNIQTRTFIAGIRGRTTGNNNAVPVLIDSDGQLGTTSSSRRFKKEIKPMHEVSEAILALKPVTFHYKSDATNTQQFGLIAEEVAQVDPDLIVRDNDGEIYTVRYDAVNAMLLNEFIKEHQKVDAQQKQIDALTMQLKQQQARIQKISDHLEKNSTAQLAKTD